MTRKCGGKEGGEGGSGDTKTKTTSLNLTQGTTVDALRIATSYFDKGWNVFA
jgi:hypothetical protein